MHHGVSVCGTRGRRGRGCDDGAVPVLRSTTTLRAPVRTVAGVLRDLDLLAEVGRHCGYRVAGTVRLLRAGDEVQVDAPGGRPGARARITAADVTTFGWALPSMRGAVAVTPDGAGTQLSHELRWTSDLEPADLQRVLAVWSTGLAGRVARLLAGPVVVATALVRDGMVLAAQRTRPPDLAGRWELPGGRVEAGESEGEAVVRECREELGTDVVPGGRLGTDLPIAAGVLRVRTARLATGAPEPLALEHAALRWVDAAAVPRVEWVDADRAVVPELVHLLGAPHLPAAGP